MTSKHIITGDYAGPDRRLLNGKVTWWIMGLIGVFMTAGGMGWMTTIYAQGQDNAKGLALNSARINALETAVMDMRAGQNRIEGKLDKVIEREIGKKER